MMKPVLIVPALCAMLGAAELMPSITVEGEVLKVPAGQGEEPFDEKLTLTREGIELFGPAGQASPIAALDIVPGLSVETQDAFGLSEVNAKDRGVDSNFMALAVEGIPNYSIRPIGPRENIYDLENMERIDYYRGALSPDAGSGVGSKAGLINLRWLRPSEDASGKISGRFGSDAFYKLYGRADTGRIADTFNAFLALSRSGADKWKGEGDLGPRTNIAAGLTADTQIVQAELFYNHTRQKRHDFLGLSYDQIQDLDANYDLDYQSDDPNTADYYDYYKRDLRYDELHLALKTDYRDVAYTLKLYGADYLEKSDEGTGKGTVDASRIGLDASARLVRDTWEAKAGLCGERSWLKKYVEKVATNPTRAHTGWKWLNDNKGPTELLSPYLQAGATLGNVRIEAGLRYLYYKEAANDTYLGNNSESDYDAAIASGTIAPGGSVDAMTYRLWLPGLGIRTRILEDTELFAKWGRGYQRPYRYSFAAKYASNAQGIRDKLLAQGKDLQSIVEQWDMETSDLFDIGVRQFFDAAEVGLTLFYHRHHDLLSTAYDPELEIDYLQNVGDASVYGAEIQSSIEPAPGLWFFFNPALMQSRIEENLASGGNLYDLKGNQMAEMPHFTLKAGGVLRSGAHTFSLMVRHIGERFADVQNEEKVDDYTTADVRYAYDFSPAAWRDFTYFVSVLNLGDSKYVSSIASADLLEDTPSYYVGAPRSFFMGLEGRF